MEARKMNKIEKITEKFKCPRCKAPLLDDVSQKLKTHLLIRLNIDSKKDPYPEVEKYTTMSWFRRLFTKKPNMLTHNSAWHSGFNHARQVLLDHWHEGKEDEAEQHEQS